MTLAQTRIQLKNVLFATDFSSAADQAASYASEIVKRYGARLFVLHVRPPVVNPMTQPTSWKSAEEFAKIEEDQQRRELQRVFAAARPEILIQEGDLWSNLENVVQTNKIDLIVIGTRGRSGIGKFLLGSTAEEILRNASCPVLTVGPRGASGPSSRGEIAKILYATDFSFQSIKALSYAVSLAEENQAYLTLLHVIEGQKTGELLVPDDLASASEQHLRNLITEEAKLWFAPDYVVEEGVPAEKILDVAARRHSELIVLGVHQASGVPGAAVHLSTSTVHKVVANATCPVLTIRG